jgi:phage terminase small subunit
MSPYAPPDPPRHLATDSRALWRVLTAAYEFEAQELHTLRLALEALDRANQARRAVRRHGITYEDRFGAPHCRPEIAVERDSRQAWVRLMAALDLPAEDGPEAYGRPGRDAGGRYRKRAA